MKLISPVKYNDKIYTDVEISEPRGGVIADTSKIIDNNGNIFNAFYTFVRGNINNIITKDGEVENNKEIINQITKRMSYKTVEYLAIQQILLFNENDKVEGVYICPRCNNKIYCENKNGEDTRDSINDLKINYIDNPEKEYYYKFEKELEIKNSKGEIIEVVESITLKEPTINYYIESYSIYPNDSIRLQYKVYEKSLIKVNGIDINEDWKTKYAKLFFEQQSTRELNKIAKDITQAGINGKMSKICNNCGKEFDVYLNTASFFVSALQ